MAQTFWELKDKRSNENATQVLGLFPSIRKIANVFSSINHSHAFKYILLFTSVTKVLPFCKCKGCGNLFGKRTAGKKDVKKKRSTKCTSMDSIWIPAQITLLLCKKCQYCQRINVNKKYQREKRVLSRTLDAHQLQVMIWWKYYIFNHKNYNYLDCDCFKKSPFSTKSFVRLLSDSLLSESCQSHSNL